MKITSLEKANKIKAEIDHTQSILDALCAPYTNCLRLNRFSGDRETSETYLFDSDDPIMPVLKRFFEERLKIQTQEFEKI